MGVVTGKHVFLPREAQDFLFERRGCHLVTHSMTVGICGIAHTI